MWLFCIKQYFRKLCARTLCTKETYTPLLNDHYNKNTTYYIINGNTSHIYNTEELYKLYTTSRQDPFTREPIRSHEIVNVRIK